VSKRTGVAPRPRKRFGQHFLAPAWAAKVVAAIAPQPGDVFLEIGPGTGALTMPLAATGVQVLAVEIDRDLVAALAPAVPANVTLLSGDILDVDIVAMLRGLVPQRALTRSETPSAPTPLPRFRVAGNLPYNVASPIVLRLCALHRRHQCFRDATVMVQREVADRLTARPGTKAYGVLTILPQLVATATKVLDLPPGAFSPAPKVRSSVVRFEFGTPAVHVADPIKFEQVAKGLFGQRRKTLLNALKRLTPEAAGVLRRAHLDGRRRPETLDAAEMATLVSALSP
jgi:16S rRNA (adenine1518-N6/adenine1519-N6)-dimethyltransferase